MNFFGTKSLGDSNNLVNCVSSNDFYTAKNFIEFKGYDERELNNVTDCHLNNLLHLSVLNCNHQMVTYFLDKGISYTKQNRFKQSAWDLAVLSRDSSILDKLVQFRGKQENPNMLKLSELSSENDSLKTKNRELKRSNGELAITNVEFEKKYSLRNRDVIVLQTENTELKTSNKRLREEVLEVRIDNKRLKDENSNLIDKNEKLKTSVETLMNNSKK